MLVVDPEEVERLSKVLATEVQEFVDCDRPGSELFMQHLATTMSMTAWRLEHGGRLRSHDQFEKLAFSMQHIQALFDAIVDIYALEAMDDWYTSYGTNQ